MIRIGEYKAYWQTIIALVPDLQQAVMVANEAQLKDVLTGTPQYPILVATIPSASADGRDVDAYSERNSALIFVLEKTAASDRTSDSYLAMMDRLQLVCAAIKARMLEHYAGCHPVMKRLDVGSLHMDPEYNYLGHDGWSLSFKFTTNGV